MNETVPRPDVSLRELSVGDADAMLRWMLDPEVAENIGLRSTPSLQKTIAWIEQSSQDQTMVPRAIILDGRHVGNVVLDRIDSRVRSARLSIYIGEPDARGKHVGSTAVYRMLQEAFGRLQLHKVWLTVHCHNVAAAVSYARIGFVVEGVMRDEFLLQGKWVNQLYMGVLASDFHRNHTPSR